MRTFTSILGNSQKLDGGAMFGNAPKALWSKWISSDEHNRIPLNCRALLVQNDNTNILLEAGIGMFFDPKLKDRYGVVEENHVLLNSLAAQNLKHEDIHFVVLSHLHFDHAGGLLSAWQENHIPQLLFPNAKFIVSKKAWERAIDPHTRDRSSFVPHLNHLLEKSERLKIVNTENAKILGDGFSFRYSHGHTPGLLHTMVDMPAGPIIFASDLIPGTAWVHLPVTMGYDRAPEQLVDEKKEILNFAIKNHARLFYTHDHKVALSKIHQEDNGRFVATEMVENAMKVAE